MVRKQVDFLARIVTFAAIVALHACREGPAADSRWAGTIDTLESGRIIVRNHDAAVWPAGDGWQLHERFRLGTLEGDGPDIFGEIRDVELGPDGELFVLDSQAAEVRVFGPDGEHLRTFGRSGQGPGELRRPAGMALDSEDMLWVMNWGNGRYSRFDPRSGEVTDERRRLASFSMIPWPGRFDGSDRLLDVGLGGDGRPVILLLDTAFTPRDTLIMPRADERNQVHFRQGNLLVMSALVPFAPQPAWAPHPAGGIVVGEGDAYRLHWISFRGDTTLTVEVDRAAEPVTRAERDSALEAFREIGRMADGATPDRQPQVPASKPAHGAIFVDEQGHIWVRRTPVSGAAPAWDIIARDGRLLGQISIPMSPGFVPPTARAGRLAIVTTVDGVPMVIVYDLVVPPGST